MWEVIIAVFLFAVSTLVTPGPNNLMLLASGLNFGIRRTLPHLTGIALGFPLMFIAVGFGLSQVFAWFPWLYEIIKVAGTAYLLLLAWKIATTQPQTAEAATIGSPMKLWQAMLFQWVNPKAWVMTIGAVATYTTAEGDFVAQVFAIGLVFFALIYPLNGLWVVFGSALQRILKSPQQQRWFNRAMGGLLALSVAPVIWELLTAAVRAVG
jgi:threonine/homoserine/homoserine lactone efflux protein